MAQEIYIGNIYRSIANLFPKIEVNTSRDTDIDKCRSLCLLLIILCHIDCPYLLGQIRGFDVPLIVFVSGLVFYNRNIKDYGSFLKHRILRLIVQVWSFMVFYVALLYVMNGIGVISDEYMSTRRTIETFLLLDGYSYVWIIRVFIIITLLTPLLIWLARYTNNLFSMIVLAIVVLAILQPGEIHTSSQFINLIYREYFLYALAYGLIFLIGVKSRELRLDWKSNLILVVLILAFFVVNQYVNVLVEVTRGNKFPPRSFYMVYGILMSLIVWGNRDILFKKFNTRIFCFIGQNTIWIYLWHIPFVFFANALMPNWVIRYLFVLITTMLIFYFQYQLVMKTDNKMMRKYMLG